MRAVADPALDAAAIVRFGRQARLVLQPRAPNKRIVVPTPRHRAPAEAAADAECLGGGDAHHGVREHGLELVEARFAQARRHVAHDAGYYPADAVLRVAHLLNYRTHARVGARVWAPARLEAVDLLARDGVEEFDESRLRGGCGMVRQQRREEELAAYAAHECDDLDPVAFAEHFLCYGAGGDTGDGFSRA